MTLFFSSLLTIYSQISIFILGLIILIISIRLVKITLLEGEEALSEIKNNNK